MIGGELELYLGSPHQFQVKMNVSLAGPGLSIHLKREGYNTYREEIIILYDFI
jgi:hypothetical protein